MSTSETTLKLDEFYQEVYQTIMVRQDPLTGLFPASTDINEHGDYTDAWVRDNVYTIQAVWGLALAYRKAGCDNSRAYLLEQTVVKLMRGLLMSMIRQAPKVETFKMTQHPLDALHAKYDTQSGETVVGDDQWGHLQLDATAIFLLMMSQMTTAGLRIVYTHDEVNFVQNLVHYIGRAYRTPDFGIWERGNKINNGRAEVNASSVGMAKAALEAMNRLNLFGKDGNENSVIHVMADEIARSRSTLEALLPRESYSKEVDAAVLSIIGYPAFAIENQELVEKTRNKIIAKLGGRYGCKRFLLDGHQTVMEDEHRLHYENEELKNFENIESEWPLFFTYLMLDAQFRDDKAESDKYRTKLEDLLVEKDGLKLLPELFFVPFDAVEAEKAKPNSQDRVANNNLPLIWAQSLFLLGRMLDEGVIENSDLDPLNRHKRIGQKIQSELQFCVVSQNEKVRDSLSAQGIESSLLADIEPVKIMYPKELAKTLHHLGANEKLGLSGRPKRRLRSLATANLYEINNKQVLFLPQFQNHQDFYLELDNRILIEEMKTEFSYINRHWDNDGSPIQALLINPAMLNAEGSQELIEFIRNIKENKLKNITYTNFNQAIQKASPEVLLDVPSLPEYCPTLGAQVMPTYLLPFDELSTQVLSFNLLERLEEPPSQEALLSELVSTSNLFRQTQILQALLNSMNLVQQVTLPEQALPVSLETLVEEVYQRACEQSLWAIVRITAGLLNKSHYGLADAVTELIVRQKQVIVGRSYSSEGTIVSSESNHSIVTRIDKCCGKDAREEMIHQEVLLFLSYAVKSDPKIFKNMISIRTNEFIHLAVTQVASELGITHGEGFDLLASMSPQALQQRLKTVISSYKETQAEMLTLEALNSSNTDFNEAQLDQNQQFETRVADWTKWRLQFGALNRMPTDFYDQVRIILHNCQGIVLGDKFNSSNQIDSSLVLGSMTAGEPAFALLIEGLLNDIPAPDYRHLTLEALLALSAFCKANPELKIDNYLVIDVIIGHAVRLNWIDRYPAQEQNYAERKAAAWKTFYQSSPQRVAQSTIKALEFLLRQH